MSDTDPIEPLTITDDAKATIREFYERERDDAPVPALALAHRLEAVARLSGVFARLRLSDTVTAADAEQAIETLAVAQEVDDE